MRLHMILPKRCPKCGSEKILKILYGLMEDPLMIDEKKYYLAGCVDEGFAWHCDSCRFEWDTSGEGKRQH